MSTIIRNPRLRMHIGARFARKPKACTFCGCTEKRACPGGCSWYSDGAATLRGGRVGAVCTACIELAQYLGLGLLQILRDDHDTMLNRWGSLDSVLARRRRRRPAAGRRRRA